MRNEGTNRLRMAGVAVAAGLGTSGMLVLLNTGGAQTAKEVVQTVASEAPASDPTDGLRGASQVGAGAAGLANVAGGLHAGAADVDERATAAASGASSSEGSVNGAAGTPIEPTPEQVEVVIPHRVIVTMPQYRPGTAPTVTPPRADVTPPAVSRDENRIIIDLPQASTTRPSVQPGQPGRLTPPSVAFE